MNNWQAIGNKHLFYALELLGHVTEVKALPACYQAILNSVVLTLNQAWLAWLQELSSYTGANLSHSRSFADTAVADLPECQYLCSFLSDPESWLSLLLLRVESDDHGIVNLLEASTSVKQPISPTGINRIELVQIEQDEAALLKRIISEFKDYLRSVRSRQIEW